MKNKLLITILAIAGLIFGIIGLILSFLPLGTVDLMPAFIGLILGFIAYLLSRKSHIRRNLILFTLAVSVLAILISLFSAIFLKPEVAQDTQFEEKIEQSAEESTEDLEEALEDLEELDDED